MKSLFRYVLATMLATTVYYYSNGTENTDQVLVQTQIALDQYEIIDEDNDDFGAVGSRSLIESKCPSGPQLCAVNVADGSDTIEWHGGTTKF